MSPLPARGGTLARQRGAKVDCSPRAPRDDAIGPLHHGPRKLRRLEDMGVRHSMSGFPTIETDRLLLREIVAADAPALFAIHSDAQAMRWFGSDPLTEL